ncbi:MAG: T-complex protein 1 subunit delta [Bogoriella megaspora]|nr:MAG: T-complex protein 1 subunit delta [Bogoriella megaspora]
MATAQVASSAGNNAFKDKEKPQAVRTANIVAARAVADAIRTSLGPRGMDKMVGVQYVRPVQNHANHSTDSNWQRRNDYSAQEAYFFTIQQLTNVQTNDGNTMLKDMSVMHPSAKMLVDLANAQDIEAGDGTTSVVVIAGSLLGAAERLLAKGNAIVQIWRRMD